MLHLPDTVGELLGVGGENALPRIVAKETRRANVETSKIVHIPLRETVEPTITHTHAKKKTLTISSLRKRKITHISIFESKVLGLVVLLFVGNGLALLEHNVPKKQTNKQNK